MAYFKAYRASSNPPIRGWLVPRCFRGGWQSGGHPAAYLILNCPKLSLGLIYAGYFPWHFFDENFFDSS
jgi:hypothetical protein